MANITEKTTARDYRISYIRAISTVMVVGLHILKELSYLFPSYYRFTEISDWCNLGLVMFFVISGFLYSGRTIEKNKTGKWFLRRYLELIIPSLFTVIIAAVLVTAFKVRGDMDRSWILSALFSGLGLHILASHGWMTYHYWFLSYILLCYLTVPLIQRIDFHTMSTVRFWCLLIFATVFIQGVSFAMGLFTPLPTFSWGVLLRFYLPYALFKRYNIKSNMCKKIMIIITLLSIILIPVACVLRYYPGLLERIGGVQELFYIYTQTLSGLSLFYWLYCAFDHIKAHIKLIKFTDTYSYPVYLTHGLFIGSENSLSVISRFDNRFLGIAVALACTAVASFVVFRVTKPIKKLIIDKMEAAWARNI